IERRLATDAITLMREIPLFRQLELAELHLLFAIGSERGVPKGTTLGVGGRHLDTLWVLLEGRVAVNSPLNRMGTSRLEGPAVWGSSALVDPFHSIGTAVTDTDCRMVAIP